MTRCHEMTNDHKRLDRRVPVFSDHWTVHWTWTPAFCALRPARRGETSFSVRFCPARLFQTHYFSGRNYTLLLFICHSAGGTVIPDWCYVTGLLGHPISHYQERSYVTRSLLHFTKRRSDSFSVSATARSCVLHSLQSLIFRDCCKLSAFSRMRLNHIRD